jgi:hypothetical protein
MLLAGLERRVFPDTQITLTGSRPDRSADSDRYHLGASASMSLTGFTILASRPAFRFTS